MALLLDRVQLAALQHHVEGTYPYEGGGWLIGRADELGRKVVTELIQGDFRPERVVGEVEALLAGPRRQEVLSGLAEVRGRLGPPGASARAAGVVAQRMAKA